jgi:signal transduction histidine kinase
MEAAEKLSFMSAILPFAVVVFIIAIGVILLTQQFRKNLYRQQLEQEELKNKHQVELLNATIQAQEEERKRIARDMHDELGATLSIARMHLVQAEKLHASGNEKLLADLQNIRSLTENSLASMRRISHQLMPPQLEEFGLLKTLEALAEQLNTAGETKLELIIPDALTPPPWPIALTAYRVISELVNNTIKHAQASCIVITLSVIDTQFILNYHDNGIGLPDGSPTNGIGLRSIEGRIRVHGGTFMVGNHSNGGFYARIALPVKG